MLLAYIAISIYIPTATFEKYKLKPIRLIALKDYAFTGEDPRVRSELDRRMGTNIKSVVTAPNANQAQLLTDFLVTVDDAHRNQSLRRQTFNNPTEYTLRFKILDMIRQAIYATQYRLDVMDVIMAKYAGDPKFRISYMFSKLDEWLDSMKTIWTVVGATRQYIKHPEGHRFRVYKHMLYYAHMLRRNIDITYTVEEIIRIHNEIYTNIESKEEDEEDTDGKREEEREREGMQKQSG